MRPRVAIALAARPKKKRPSKLGRRMARRRELAERWREKFRGRESFSRDPLTGARTVRIAGAPVNSKRERKRELLRQAQKISPAIRTVKGAQKLEKRLEREYKAGAR